jgi:hypothetical protein
MTTLVELVGGAGLTDVEVDQLLAITAEWQVLADLSFADLVLFVHDRELDQFVAVAQMRPYTAQTIYHEDLVGERWDATSARLSLGRLSRAESCAMVIRTGPQVFPSVRRRSLFPSTVGSSGSSRVRRTCRWFARRRSWS